jgi:hypothetical protein
MTSSVRSGGLEGWSVERVAVGERGKEAPEVQFASGRRICDVRMQMRQAVAPACGVAKCKM